MGMMVNRSLFPFILGILLLCQVVGLCMHGHIQYIISMIEKIRERTKNTKQTLIFELTHKIVVHNWANINVGN